MTSTGTKPHKTTLPKRVAGPPPKGGWWAHAAWVLNKTTGFGFVAVLLLASGGLLIGLPQGRDLLQAAVGATLDGASHHDGGPFAWLLFAALVLGLSAWFWTRAIVGYQFGPDGNWEQNRYLVWAPRVLGLLPFGFVSAGLTQVLGFDVQMAAVLALGLAFLLFVFLRRRLVQRLHRAGERMIAQGRVRSGRAIHATLATGRGVFLAASLIAAALGLLISIVAPVGPAQALGPAAVALLALAMIIPVMTVLIQWGHEHRIATLAVLFALAFVCSFTSDNHAVRLTGAAAAPRPDVPAAFARWRASLPPSDKPVPIIFVVAQGGASRAGYWTGDALSWLEEQSHGAFSRHVFAISSISGGSLGAAAFLAALHDQPQLAEGGQLRARVACFTEQDYLSPALGALLFPDLVQRFNLLPAPLHMPDRAKALEAGWEAGWGKDCDAAWAKTAPPTAARMSQPFLSLWDRPAGPWLPNLMIGGAAQETGGPLITSNLVLQTGPTTYVYAGDFHALAGRDVRLSTAILNGARFPYISPGGTLPNRQHVVDGGYFDATGTEAVRELAQTMFDARNHQLDPKPGAPPITLRPIYLEILNGEAGDPAKPNRFAQDLMGPLRGLFHSREAHGALLKRNLAEYPPGVGGQPGEVIRISLCHDLAMDWALSDETVRQLRYDLEHDQAAEGPKPAAKGERAKKAHPACTNMAEMTRLLDVLAGRK